MRKIHQRRYTIFIYCEGKTDSLFVQHLKKLYSQRGVNQITIKQGTGGDCSTFITEIINNAQVRDFDEKYIVLDSNGKTKEELTEAKKKGQEHNIQLIWQKPCLEGVFLRILKGAHFVNEKSKKCKSFFEKEYMAGNISLEILLEKLFTKDKLDTKRRDIEELDQIIQLMQKSSQNQ